MSVRTLWKFPIVMIVLALAAGCVRPAPEAPTYVPGGGSELSSLYGSGTPTASFRLPPTRIPGSTILTPTPDFAHYAVATRGGPLTYTVRAGDTLGAIAQRYRVSVDAILQANGMSDPNRLEVGQTLVIPLPDPQPVGTSFKIIPDSELVYGPMSILLDLEDFIADRGGYLATYTQEVYGETLTGAQIIQRVAENYSVNPRLLLALIEHRAGWVTKPNPDPATWADPLGLGAGSPGLYLQLTWAANELNRGYYLWRAGGVDAWVLADGNVVPISPTINAGTAGVQGLFARLDYYSAWVGDVSPEGFFYTYSTLFGYPFDLAIEPLVPTNLIQPPLRLPFAPGETWYFTGGPHPGWDTGSAWAALDFAPPGDWVGCVQSDSWVTAMADGLITRAFDGAVIQDLDGDGFEQTGWVILYMHVESRDRVQPGTFLRAGERIGHPSCEGGVSNGTHVHVARRFNGEWIPADGSVPFNMDGWISSGAGVVYDGYLRRGDQVVEAYDGAEPLNQISP
jgi:LasA protease